MLSLFLFSRETHAYSIFKADLLNLLRMGKIFEPSEERATFNKDDNIVKYSKKFPKKTVFTSKIYGILSWSPRKYCVRIRPFHEFFLWEINLRKEFNGWPRCLKTATGQTCGLSNGPCHQQMARRKARRQSIGVVDMNTRLHFGACFETVRKMRFHGKE